MYQTGPTKLGHHLYYLFYFFVVVVAGITSLPKALGEKMSHFFFLTKREKILRIIFRDIQQWRAIQEKTAKPVRI